MYRGRFAPSPTGDLHLGSAASALVGWLAARQAGGRFILRIEDLDTPRVRAGCEPKQREDLLWLGLDWDEGPDVGGGAGPYRQSERLDRYTAALEQLRAHGAVYDCDCSRAELGRVASAPHAGEGGAAYPGLCRDEPSGRALKRPPAQRLRTPAGLVHFEDRFRGPVCQDVPRVAGDFVLRRGDGIFAYQLAVVVDDLEMGVTEVVRGADLLESTPRQLVLAGLLGGRPPRYAHHPLLVAADGGRLAKRANGISLSDYRAAGVAPERVVAMLARALGLLPSADRGLSDERLSPRELVASADLGGLRRADAVVIDPVSLLAAEPARSP